MVMLVTGGTGALYTCTAPNTWSVAGGTPGAPTGSIQGNNSGALGGTPNTSVNFTTGRVDINNLSNTRVVTPAYNWTITPGGSYTGGSGATLTFAGTCPLGVSGSDANLYVYISGGTGTAEATVVTGGTCSPGFSGNLNFTPANNHSGAFTVSSASSGIYEAYKDATPSNVNNVHLIVPPTNPPNSSFYSIFAPVTITGSDTEIDGGAGAMIDCEASRACFVMPNTNVGPVHIHGFRYGTKATLGAGNTSAAITNTACASNVSTITTTLNPPVGSYVDVQQTFNSHYWGPHLVATTSGSSWTYADTNCGGATTIASAASAGGNAYEFAFIETNGEGTQIDHISINSPAGFQSNTLNHLVVILNDQNFHISDIQVNSGLGGCVANYCADLVYAPGPFSTNAAVVYADHIGGSLFCTGNGFTLWNGNTSSISDAVIQGFAEWAIYTGNFRGGFGGITLSNVYNEVGACTNPWYSGSGLQVRAEAGILQGGGQTTVRGGEFPLGQMPRFAATGNQNTQYNYWLVVHDSGLGVSAPLACGNALVDSVTPTGSITVQCPRVPGTNTITYDLLRNTGTSINLSYPFNGGCAGGSTTACGSVLTAQAQCATPVCSFSDTASANTSSYAVATPAYFPFLPFWPGGAVLGTSGDSTNAATAPSGLSADNTAFITPLSPIVASVGTLRPTVSAGACTGNTTGVWAQCQEGTSSGNNNANVVGTIFQNGPVGGAGTGVKGRLNILDNPGANIFAGQHRITIVDSNPAKTLASAIFRPSTDANDSYIGTDVGTTAATAGTSYGSPVSHSFYVANAGDGSSWLERLTASIKTIKPPLDLPEQAAPANPASGTDRIYADSTSHAVKCLTSSGGACLTAGFIQSGSALPAVPCASGAVFNLTGAGGLEDTLYRCSGAVGNSTWQQIKPTVETVYARDYGVSGASIIVNDATTNSTSSVSISGSDPAFTATNPARSCGKNACVGDLVEVVSGDGVSTGSSACPAGTILSINSATNITISTTCTQTLSATGLMVWGPDDSTTLDTAYQAALASCSQLQLPSGVMLVKQPEFNYAGTTCANTETYQVPGVFGASSTGTIIIPMQNFNPSAGHGCTAIACFFGVKFQLVFYLKVWGLGIPPTTNPGAGGAVNLVLNNGSVFFDVALLGWCPVNTCANTTGFMMTNNQAEGLFGGTIGFGQTLCSASGVLIKLDNWPCYTGNVGLFVNNAATTVISRENFFGGNTFLLDVAAGASLDSNNDTDSFQNGGTNIINGTLHAHHFTHTGTTAGGLTIGNAGKVYSNNSSWPQDAGNHTLTFTGTGGQFIDLGGNTFTGTTTGTGTVVNQASITGTVITAAKAVLSAGWGNTPTAAWSGLGGFNSFTGTITNGSAALGANPTITYTFPTPYITAPQYCIALQIGGTNATGTFATSSLTATGVVFTYSLTPTGSATEVVNVQCYN